MFGTLDGFEADERLTRQQILTFIDEYCRELTLADVRVWYADAFGLNLP